jgi:hypothetical protein
VPAPGAGFQSQLISRITPVSSSPDPAEFQTQAPPHAILKAEGHTNVTRSQHAAFPKQRDQARPEPRHRRAIDDFFRPQSPASRNYETNPIPFSNTREARERNSRIEPNFAPNPNKMKPLAPLQNEPNSPPAPSTSRSQPAPLSSTRKARERNSRNEPNSAPNPNQMKPLAPLAKRTQFPLPGPRPLAPGAFSHRRMSLNGS